MSSTAAGRLDLMFNNAGITWAADTELLTLEQWNSIIDVNIRGVVHGVAAAYPQMVRQGHGHIVNTASMAGLAAAGLITSYVMTKHAVVGLSLALRTEAAAHGVGVLAICPDRGGDADPRQGPDRPDSTAASSIEWASAARSSTIRTGWPATRCARSSGTRRSWSRPGSAYAGMAFRPARTRPAATGCPSGSSPAARTQRTVLGRKRTR